MLKDTTGHITSVPQWVIYEGIFILVPFCGWKRGVQHVGLFLHCICAVNMVSFISVDKRPARRFQPSQPAACCSIIFPEQTWECRFSFNSQQERANKYSWDVETIPLNFQLCAALWKNSFTMLFWILPPRKCKSINIISWYEEKFSQPAAWELGT